MGGFFAVASIRLRVRHLLRHGLPFAPGHPARRHGRALNSVITRFIHDITGAPFRSKLEADLSKLRGRWGSASSATTRNQPLIIGSHLGQYAIVTVGRILNADALARQAFRSARRIAPR